MTGPARPLVIAGGGLAGCLAAIALVRRRPEVPLLLVEQGRSFGGNHVWSFFDSDVAAEHRALADLLRPRRWPSHEVRFPRRRRTLSMGYNSVRSERLDEAVRSALKPHQYRLGRRIAEVGADHLILDGGERIDASAVIDARGPRAMAGLELGWQKFVGRTYRFERPHGCARPVIMDATVEQLDGYRFVYLLPFGPHELMIEDTYYSASPMVRRDEIGERIDAVAARLGAGAARIRSEETGVLPVLLGGDVETLWSEGPAVARLGLAGGFFHPTTGYSLPDAVRNAALLAEQRDFSTAALHRLFRGRAESQWKDRHFFQLLNRMLFSAAEPRLRYRVLEHFYRLPEPLIARFYAAQLTALDKLRIVSGRPPVPVGRAIQALRRSAA